jgi:hypothetical protein
MMIDTLASQSEMKRFLGPKHASGRGKAATVGLVAVFQGVTSNLYLSSWLPSCGNAN